MTDRSPAAAVERRVDTLRALDEAPDSKAGIAERIDASRSTVDRSLRDLATHGFVTRTADGYRLTLPGRVALDAHERRRDRIDDAAAVAPLFDEVDVGVQVDPAVFDGGRVVEARAHAPNRPFECVSDLVAGATHVSVYSAWFCARYGRLYHDRVRDGMTGSFIVAGGMHEHERSTPPKGLREAVDRGHAAVRHTDREEPVTLVLAETPDGPKMGLVACLDGVPQGFVGNDTPAATRWARDLHERLWASATPFFDD